MVYTLRTMPELPEVETITRRLHVVLPGKVVAAVDVFTEKSFLGKPSQLVGMKISNVTRRAKMLAIELVDAGIDTQAEPSTFVLTHLKMTGQLIYVSGAERVGGGHPTADWTKALPSAHTRISYHFTDGTALHFNDMRLFGWMKVLDEAQLQKHYQKLGPDINDLTLTQAYLFDQFQRRGVAVKQVLMDPSVVCGVGNIYACDALNLAKISPFRAANSLSKIEVGELLTASQQVIERGIDLQGTTFDGKYVTVDGMSGRYQEEVLAYGREGKTCFNCGAPIQKSTLGGRGTYFCGVCQR